MAKSTRRARLILLVIPMAAVALCISLWWDEGPLWRVVMLEKVTHENHDYGVSIRGWHYVHRLHDEPYGRWRWLPQDAGPSVAKPVPEPDLPGRSSTPLVGEHGVRGWESVLEANKGIRQGRSVLYYADNGFLAIEGTFDDGFPVAVTEWNFDGTVEVQWMRDDAGNQVEKESPPWWWDVTDQTEPTAPWWKGDEQ